MNIIIPDEDGNNLATQLGEIFLYLNYSTIHFTGNIINI